MRLLLPIDQIIVSKILTIKWTVQSYEAGLFIYTGIIGQPAIDAEGNIYISGGLMNDMGFGDFFVSNIYGPATCAVFFLKSALTVKFFMVQMHRQPAPVQLLVSELQETNLQWQVCIKKLPGAI